MRDLLAPAQAIADFLDSHEPLVDRIARPRRHLSLLEQPISLEPIDDSAAPRLRASLAAVEHEAAR